MRKKVIFGAGKYGIQALEFYGSEVAYFIDNDPLVQGTEIRGVIVKSVSDFLSQKDYYQVVIASAYAEAMEKQLVQNGVTDYLFFYKKGFSHFYETEQIVFNPYESKKRRMSSEEEYNAALNEKVRIASINQKVMAMSAALPLFELVEIETINRCNGLCDFCPVNAREKQREYAYMPDELFEKIILELSSMDYKGRLSLFSNNEPFLDPKIIERHTFAREKVPKSRMHLFTNGSLLTIEKFVQILDYLDELIIDNYDADLELTPQCREVADYCENHPELKKKVTIVLRNPHEILSNRAGNAPNRFKSADLGEASCILPFQEIEIRPDGKVSLCCCDALGKYTLGDVSKRSLLDIWYGEKYREVRNRIRFGIKNLKACMKCDYLSGPI